MNEKVAKRLDHKNNKNSPKKNSKAAKSERKSCQRKIREQQIERKIVKKLNTPKISNISNLYYANKSS